MQLLIMQSRSYMKTSSIDEVSLKRKGLATASPQSINYSLKLLWNPGNDQNHSGF